MFELTEPIIEDSATPREQLNEELKQHIRAHAETICNLIDNQERLLKAKEDQLHAMARELDRRTNIH